MTRPAIALLAAAAAASGLAGAAAPTPAKERAACAKPTGLVFVRKTGSTSGLLRWKRPRALPKRAAGYRVLRNGEVVGQTRATRMRVKVKPGTRVKLAVRVALRDGSTLRCAATTVRRLPWRPPGPTSNLVAQPIGEGIVLRWDAAARGEGRLAGYRVFRDGTALRQVKARTLAIPLPSLRSFAFTVAAVDVRGTLGRQSNVVLVTVGHEAPTTPTGLVGEAVSDREVQLRWQPSTSTRGARVAYRVLRDGVTVAQTGGPEARLGNLRPATSYAFSVLAVDSLGYASVPSEPVQVTTREPERSAGGAHVFLLASTDQSFRAFQERYRQIHTVYPTYFDCRPDGTFSGRDDPLITGWARLRGVKVHARMNCQRTATLSYLLNTPAVREAAIGQIASLAEQHGWDGINLDFEAGLAADRNAYSAFFRDLAARLHAGGKELSVDVSAKTRDVPNHPRSTFFDYDALSLHADRLFVMAWGKHWSTSVPGAIDEWSWVRQVADYVAARPRKEKYVLGFGMYGFDWPNGGGPANKATPLEHADVLALMGRVGASEQWDSTQQAPMFTYVEGGTRHDVWFTNARSLGMRIELAREKGLGIGLWRLGREDPGIWAHPLLQPGVPWP
jgi:spore germination protein YaaH